MRCPTSPGIPPPHRRAGFSLIELLVVIAIIAILAALLFSGVQAAREAANKAICANNLSQMALAANSHVTLYGRYPTGGWGWSWVGDPDRPPDKSQPGGWIYNILPFMEYRNIHDMGKGLPQQAKQQAISQRVGITIKEFNCPTRPRVGNPYSGGADVYKYYGESGSTPCPAMARADYASNAGDNGLDELWPGPGSEAEGDTPGFPWHNTTGITGTTFERSWIRQGDITKGISNVYLYGEKYLNPDHYNNGQDPADNENMYCGMDNDLSRDTNHPPHRDQAGWTDTFSFGSNHRGGCNMAYCDGSVRWVNYTVSPTVHMLAGVRQAN